jgi:hypothetical protein
MKSAIHTEGMVERLGDLIVLDAIDLRRAGHRWIIVVSLRGWRWARGLHGRKTIR